MTETEFQQSRKDHLDAILSSQTLKKLIVAGPGTGKTHTFKALLNQNGGDNLVMTFINNLFKDLAEELNGIAEVSTFHGYCKHLLHTHPSTGLTTNVDYYPQLSDLVSDDISVQRGSRVATSKLDGALLNLDDTDGLIAAQIELGNYYNSVGYNDSVYRVYKLLEDSPELIKPYTQIVVDEYQDFSLLEVSFLKVLSTKSPILVAGDDDQALYGFKHGSADYIRNLFASDEYENFELPFCTRCTEVITTATATLIKSAISIAKLSDRIDKPYICYLPDKQVDSDRYPKIIWANTTVQTNRSPYMAMYIEQKIRDIPAEDIADSKAKNYPTVLIVGPKQFTKPIVEYLLPIFPNIVFKTSISNDISILDGYRRLVRDAESILGWRIVAECEPPQGWKSIHKEAVSNIKPLHSLLTQAYKDDHSEAVAIIGKILADEEITAEEQSLIESKAGIELARIKSHLVSDEDADQDEQGRAVDPETPTITATSLLGAKGLQAGHVFVVGLNEGHFPRHNDDPTDDEICELLVALTRTKKCCYLISTDRFGITTPNASVFINWLNPLLTKVAVSQMYFKDLASGGKS